MIEKGTVSWARVAGPIAGKSIESGAGDYCDTACGRSLLAQVAKGSGLQSRRSRPGRQSRTGVVGGQKKTPDSCVRLPIPEGTVDAYEGLRQRVVRLDSGEHLEGL